MTDVEIKPTVAKRLRVSEIYISIQGEGPNVGSPVQFVRFAGCNLRCPAWPCDTPHAIEPSIYIKESRKYGPIELFADLADWPRALCFTGGEPFLQPRDEMDKFIKLCSDGRYHIECFTNGTFELPMDLNIRYILDWKLAGSGEALNTTQHAQRLENVRKFREVDAIKFTVAHEQDLREAVEVWRTIQQIRPGMMPKPQFYIGAVWDRVSDKDLVEWMLENDCPWKLNVQLHKHIWPADERGV